MIRTRFAELVGCTVPIQQAAMGVASPPELAAAEIVRELAEEAERLLGRRG